MVNLSGIGAFGGAIYPGYMSGQRAVVQNRLQQLGLQDAEDMRRASLAAILDSSGVDPTTATIAALSGSPVPPPSPPLTPASTSSPTVIGAPGTAAATPTLPMGGGAPSAGDMPAGPGGSMAPSPTVTPTTTGMPPTGAPQMRPTGMPGIGGFGQGQMSLGQMFQRLRADPKNAGIPDAMLFNIAAKAQQTLLAPDRAMLQMMMPFITRNLPPTPYEQARLAQSDRQLAATEGMRGATLELAKQRLALTESLQSGAQLSDEDAKFLAQQRLAGDKSALTGLGFGNIGSINRRKVNSAMRELMQEKYGKAGGEFVAQATAAFMGDTAAARALATQAARIDTGAIEMKKFAPLVRDALSKIDTTKYPSVNAVLLALQKGTGDENVIRLGNAINEFENAYAQVVTRGGASTEGARQNAREVLNKNWAPGQIEAALQQLESFADQARASARQARADLLGDIGGGPSSVGGGSTPSSSGASPASGGGSADDPFGILK